MRNDRVTGDRGARPEPDRMDQTPLTGGEPNTHREGTVMHMFDHDLARSRMGELHAEAAAASRARRLYLARRASRRAERAVRRAARASAAVY
jgi:hypothetical protein